MVLNEDSMLFLEKHIPNFAEVAFKQLWLLTTVFLLLKREISWKCFQMEGLPSSKAYLSVRLLFWVKKEAVKNNTHRVRMFAGPNGSGKSTFKSIIQPELIGLYINPDEIEKQKDL